jgi:hypothetical protein
MKQTTLIGLMIASMIILAILAACSTLKATDDSQQVTKIAAEIADFDVPLGYTPEFSVEMLGYSLAAYKGTTDPSHLYLIQSENESDREELERILTEWAPGSSDPNTGMTVIENRPASIRSQGVTLVISEGINSENIAYRQISVAFEGKGGPALLVLSESIANWDQAAIDEFLASIR